MKQSLLGSVTTANKLTPKRVTLHETLRRQSEIKKCQDGVKGGIYFVCNYLTIAEPRAAGNGEARIPFNMWEFQKDYFRKLEEHYQTGKGVVAKKCRDMGITLTTLAWIFWKWRFTKHYSALLGSLREEEVKKVLGTTDPLFSKLDVFIQSLPPWLLPEGFNYNLHSQSMNLINPETEAVITGSSMTANFGLSKRSSTIFIDEVAQLERDVSGQCQQTTYNLIQVSTVNGHNHFEETCKRAERIGELVELPYYLNPLHDDAWLQWQEEHTTPVDFARYIKMNFDASAAGQVYEDFNKVRISEEYDYNPELPLVTATDFGIADDTVILFIQRNPDTADLYVVDEFVANNQDIEFFVPFYPGSRQPTPYDYILTPEQDETMLRLRGYKRARRHFGDKSGNQRTQASKQTVWQILGKFGITMQLDDTHYQNMNNRVRITRQALKRLHVHPRCTRFIRSMQGYHYAEKMRGSSSTDARPVHDEHSHAATAFEFFCISEKFLERDAEKDKELPKTIYFSHNKSYSVTARRAF